MSGPEPVDLKLFKASLKLPEGREVWALASAFPLRVSLSPIFPLEAAQ